MASFLENKDRRVIPNWRDFKRTARLGELNDNTFQVDSSFETSYLDKYIRDWEFSNTIGHAADLLNAAFVADYSDDSIKKAAKFVVDNEHHSSPELFHLALRFLPAVLQKSGSSLIQNQDSETFQSLFEKNKLYEKIHFFKEKIRQEPKNVIARVELSRIYSLVGEKEKAIETMEIARLLSPDNRFVVRSFSRLLIHCREFDRTKFVLHRNRFLETDPWILSVEISLAQIMRKRSRLIKKGTDLLENKKIKPLELTELASALGTLHFYDDNLNQSKKFFNQSLINPNDNTLAQAEWIKSKHLNLRIPENAADIPNAFEALAIEKFEEANWVESFQLSKRWLVDLPYSKRPVSMGAYIGTVILKDYEMAETICSIGLQANPTSPEIINNYSYLLALQNKTKEALKILERSYHLDPLYVNDSERIVLQGTAGLIYFRSGYIEQGREAYDTALKNCQKIDNNYLYNIGLLNLLREEILLKSEQAHELYKKAESVLKNDSNVDIVFIKNEIFDLYKRQFENISA